MRSYDPTDEYDVKDLARLNAKPWMVELLKLNPEYVHWGPGEDYMWTKEDKGWGASKTSTSWTDFGPWGVDELNEIVHFYFQIARESKDCTACDQSGYNPKTHQISEDFYDFEGTGRKWYQNITQDEVEALVEHNRLVDFTKTFVEGKGWVKNDPFVMPTAEQVNTAYRTGMGHDAINKGILVETRAKRLGVYGLCPECSGHGTVYTKPEAHMNVVLWFIHPRKGASRGVRVQNIQENEIPEVIKYLQTAAERNQQRFNKIMGVK